MIKLKTLVIKTAYIHRIASSTQSMNHLRVYSHSSFCQINLGIKLCFCPDKNKTAPPVSQQSGTGIILRCNLVVDDVARVYHNEFSFQKFFWVEKSADLVSQIKSHSKSNFSGELIFAMYDRPFPTPPRCVPHHSNVGGEAILAKDFHLARKGLACGSVEYVIVNMKDVQHDISCANIFGVIP